MGYSFFTMKTRRIAELLDPFLNRPVSVVADSGAPGRSDTVEAIGPHAPTKSLKAPQLQTPDDAPGAPRALTDAQLDQISIYIDLLLRWNARVNLTAIRQPEKIVTRHFGESLFTARHLFPRVLGGEPAVTPVKSRVEQGTQLANLLDLGSGAGFPGIPIKIWSPSASITLIESNQKKVAFLREVIRALTLTDINVFPARAGAYPAASAPVVTVRAVERFDQALLTAASLMVPGGTLALLIGTSQLSQAKSLLPYLTWSDPQPIPLSTSRVLVCATQIGEART
jgi:16S rRNA (guanine527-N7)-methyltransferase